MDTTISSVALPLTPELGTVDVTLEDGRIAAVSPAAEPAAGPAGYLLPG